MEKNLDRVKRIYAENNDISLSDALSIVGSEDLLWEVLDQFCSSSAENIEETENLMLRRDYENYTIKVHALKSTARTIGANKLSDTAMKLEELGKKAQIGDTEARKSILRNTFSCMELYLKLSLVFSGLFSHSPDFEKPEAPESFWDSFFTYANTLSVEFDSAGLEQLMEKAEGYRIPPEAEESFAGFRKAFLDFEWDEMMEISEKAMSDLEKKN